MAAADFISFPSVEQLHPLFYIGLLLLASYAGGEIANSFRAPRVTGYLLVGMLLSPSGLHLLRQSLVEEDLALITHIALSIIAFSIGGSLELTKTKKLGRQIAVISLTQAFGAFLVSTLVLAVSLGWILNADGSAEIFWSTRFPLALVIGSICAATAPAAVLAIVHEYGAKGPFTTTLLGVVALDDALTIFLYAFAGSFALGFLNHQPIAWRSFLVAPIFSIFVSTLIGSFIGFALRKLVGLVKRREAMLGVMGGSIFFSSGLALSFHSSPLLANMTLGFVVVNFVDHHDDLFTVVESIEEAIFGMFFCLAGAHLNLGVVTRAGWLALAISLGRFAGKVVGSYLGAEVTRAQDSVRKYLGLSLLPTAGVTLGLVLEAKDLFESKGLSEIMVNAVLASVIVNEVLTPFFVRFCLSRAGEVTKD